MTGPKGFQRQDDYAAHRCGCGHIVYLDDQVGGHCRFCSCGNHRPPSGHAEAGGDGR